MQRTNRSEDERARGVRAATAAALAVGLIVAGLGEAEAGKKGAIRKMDLVREAGATDADAVGRLKIRAGKKGETARLRLRNLDPRTWYEVRDADSGDVLGRVRTNRRGKAKMKIRRKVRAGKVRFAVPDEIEVRVRDTGEPLLRVDTGDDVADFPSFGWGEYAGADDHVAWVDLLSLPDAGLQSFILTVQPPFDPEATEDVWHELIADTSIGDELPLGAETVTDLAGRRFRIVNGRGAVIVRGVLPEMETFRRPEPPDIIDDGPWFPEPGDDGVVWRFPDDGMLPPEMPFDERPRNTDPARAKAFDGLDSADPFGGLFDVDRGMFEDWMNALPGMGDDLAYDDMIFRMPPDWMPFPLPQQERSDLVLEVADANGDLQDAGRLVRWSVERPDRPWIDHPRCPMDDDRPDDDAPDGSDRPNDGASDDRDDGSPTDGADDTDSREDGSGDAGASDGDTPTRDDRNSATGRG